MSRSFLVASAALILSACGGGGGGNGGTPTPPPPSNQAPTAKAGNDISQDISASGVNLDGTQSSDPDGDTLRYSWVILQQPNGETATLNNANTSTPNLQSFGPGDYTVELTVSDPSGAQSKDSVVITLINQSPVADGEWTAGSYLIGDKVPFSGIASTDSNDQTLTFTWDIISFPNETRMPLTYTGVNPEIVFDTKGDFTVRLTVSDGYLEDSVTLPTINLQDYIVTEISSDFIDAAYDEQTSSTVIIQDKVLTKIESNGAISTVDLSLNAVALSLVPGKSQAVVGHDGWVTHVDLNQMNIINEFNIPAPTFDIIATENNTAHIVPAIGQWVNIIDLNLTNGAISQTARVRHRSKIKLHPSGDKFYATTTDTSPGDVERFDIVNGESSAAYDSPYHGDYPVCADLYMGPGEDKIMTRCGVAFRATENRDTDLTYMTRLRPDMSLHSVDGSQYDNSWYLIANNHETKILKYSADSYAKAGEFELPEVSAGSTPWEGQYVFARSDSNSITVLAKDDLLNPVKFAVIRRGAVELDSTDNPPVVKAQKFKSAQVLDGVTVDASGSYDPEGAMLRYDWRVISQPANSALDFSNEASSDLTFTPQVAGIYQIELKVSDGKRDSAPKIIEIAVYESGELMAHRLEGNMGDSAFSRSQNLLVRVSDTRPEVLIFDLGDMTEYSIDLDLQGYTVDVSPDGLFAAVSHDGKVSLIDLLSKSVVDSQPFGAEWGDIVLDHDYVAHIIPHRDQWVNMYSLDFASNNTVNSGGARAGTIIRMNPVKNWVHAITRGLSPQDHDRYDVSVRPVVTYNDTYHGTYSFGSNLWVSYDGNRILTQNGNSFNAETMIYEGKVEDNVAPVWADHSVALSKWFAIVPTNYSDPNLAGKIVRLNDEFLTLEDNFAIRAVKSSTGDLPATGEKVFLNDSEDKIAVLTKSSGASDSYAIQLTDVQ